MATKRIVITAPSPVHMEAIEDDLLTSMPNKVSGKKDGDSGQFATADGEHYTILLDTGDLTDDEAEFGVLQVKRIAATHGGELVEE